MNFTRDDLELLCCAVRFCRCANIKIANITATIFQRKKLFAVDDANSLFASPVKTCFLSRPSINLYLSYATFAAKSPFLWQTSDCIASLQEVRFENVSCDSFGGKCCDFNELLVLVSNTLILLCLFVTAYKLATWENCECLLLKKNWTEKWPQVGSKAEIVLVAPFVKGMDHSNPGANVERWAQIANAANSRRRFPAHITWPLQELAIWHTWLMGPPDVTVFPSHSISLILTIWQSRRRLLANVGRRLR